jgi:hypothetical protein
MLNTFLGLNLGVNLRSGGSYELVRAMRARSRGQANIPTAAAGSRAPDFGVSTLGLPEPLASGLLLRRGSDLLAGGERERRSNLDALFGSGSVWSKRERFAVRRSVSSMVCSLPVYM